MNIRLLSTSSIHVALFPSTVYTLLHSINYLLKTTLLSYISLLLSSTNSILFTILSADTLSYKAGQFNCLLFILSHMHWWFAITVASAIQTIPFNKAGRFHCLLLYNTTLMYLRYNTLPVHEFILVLYTESLYLLHTLSFLAQYTSMRVFPPFWYSTQHTQCFPFTATPTVYVYRLYLG